MPAEAIVGRSSPPTLKNCTVFHYIIDENLIQEHIFILINRISNFVLFDFTMAWIW